MQVDIDKIREGALEAHSNYDMKVILALCDEVARLRQELGQPLETERRLQLAIADRQRAEDIQAELAAELAKLRCDDYKAALIDRLTKDREDVVAALGAWAHPGLSPAENVATLIAEREGVEASLKAGWDTAVKECDRLQEQLAELMRKP